MEKICTKACERTGTGIAASAAHIRDFLILTTPQIPSKEPYAITFTAPSGFVAEEFCTLNGSQLAVVDADGEPLQNGWKAGVPVTLMIQGNKAYYRAALGEELSTYVHIKNGAVHELTGEGKHICFHATADYADGDTFQVNGQPVTAQAMDGQGLSSGDFAAGSDVTAILDEDVLTLQFRSYTEQLNEKADAGHTHTAEQVGASPAIHVHSTDDITSGILPIERGGTGRTTGCVCNATGAGAHNSHYRGENLGSSVTDAQYSVIAAGTFDGLYIGDYWVIDGVTYRIAAFDYYLGSGNSGTTKHHAVIVPDTPLYSIGMNDTNTTEGAYMGSKMYMNNLDQARLTIKKAFPEHVLKKVIYLSNTTANGRASRGVWANSEVDLMCEHMVYGSGVFSPVSDGVIVTNNYRMETSQLPLFQFDRSRISVGSAYWWLRDVLSATLFARVGPGGFADYGNAGDIVGVRPAFCIS